MSRVFLQTGHSPQRRDCLAEVVGLELRNVVAKYLFETSHRFAGMQPNSDLGDYSRLSCGAEETQLGPSLSLVPDLGKRAARLALRRARVAGPVGAVGLDVERARG